MTTYTLNLFNTGQITLPKKWRDKFDTNKFIAKETEKGLLIQAIEDKKETVFYEDKDGFGIYCESGIDLEDIISKIKKLQNG